MKAEASNIGSYRISVILVMIMLFSILSSPQMFNEIQNNGIPEGEPVTNQLGVGGYGLESPSIFGYVTNQDGVLMGGVNISLDGTEHYVHTDHIGHYILEGISVGTINLKASKTGCNDTVVSVEHEGWTRIDIVILCYSDAHEIFGSVMDINTQIPLNGVTMTLSGEGNTFTTSTDVGGEYSFIDILEGIYQLEANHNLYDSHEIEVILNKTAIASFVLKVTEPANLSGDVLGRRGTPTDEPIIGALIRLEGYSNSGDLVFGPLDTYTDPEGHYSFTDLPPIDYTLTVISMGYDAFNTQINLAPGEDKIFDPTLVLHAAEVEFELVSSTYVTAGGDSMPLGGITLELKAQDNSAGRKINLTQITDSSGKATFNHLVPPGAYIVSIVSPTFLFIDNIQLEFENRDISINNLEPDENRKIRLDLTPRNGNMFGRVASIDNLSYNVSMLDFVDRWSSWYYYYNASNDCRIQFIKGMYEVTEYCNPANDQSYLEGATITLLSSTLNGFQVNISNTIFTTSSGDAKGAYSMTLPPGHYSIRFEKAGLETVTFQFPTPLSSGVIIPIDTITLLPTWSDVAGYMERMPVVNAGSNLINGPNRSFGNAPLRLVSGSTTYSTNTTESGLFSFKEVEAGNYILHVDHQSYADSFQVEVISGGRVVFLKRSAIPPNTAGIQIFHEQSGGSGDTAWGPTGVYVPAKIIDDQGRPFELDFSSVNTPTYQFAYGHYEVYITLYGQMGGEEVFRYDWNASSGSSSIILSLTSYCPDTSECYRTDTTAGVSKLATYRFFGYVFDIETREPIANAVVNLTADYYEYQCCDSWGAPYLVTPVPTITDTTTTDATGKYEMTATRSGTFYSWHLGGFNGGYTIDVSASMYTPHPLIYTHGGWPPVYGTHRMDFVLYQSGKLVGTAINKDTNIPIDSSTTEVRAYSRGQMGLNDASGNFVIDPLTPGLVTVSLEANGYYSLDKEVTILKGTPTNEVFELEPIPPPKILTTSPSNAPFAIWTKNGTGQLKELTGFVLKNAKHNQQELSMVDGFWEVKVDRHGIKALRPGFSDPVTSVWVEVKVVEACESLESITPVDTKFLLVGKKVGTSGSISTWKGDIDARELPCGRLEYNVHASTGMGLEDETDWTEMKVFPSIPVFLVNMFMTAGSLPNIQISMAGTDFFEFKSEVMEIKSESLTNTHSLVYYIGDASLKANLGTVVNSPFTKTIGESNWIGFRDFEISVENASVSGKNGKITMDCYAKFTALSFEKELGPQGFGKTRHKITKFTVAYKFGGKGIQLDGLINPGPSNPLTVTQNTEFREGVTVTIEYTLEKDIKLPHVAGVIQMILSELDLGKLVWQIKVGLESDFSWALSFPTVSLQPPFMGMRMIGESLDIALKLTIGAHLRLELFGSHGDLGIETVGTAEMTVENLNNADERHLIMKRVHVIGQCTYSLKLLFYTKEGKFLKITFLDWKRGTESNATLSYIDLNDHISLPDAITNPLNSDNVSATLISSDERISLSSDFYDQTAMIIARPNNSDNFDGIDPNKIQPALIAESDDGQWSKISSPPVNIGPGSSFTPALHHLSDGRIMAVWSHISEVDEFKPSTFILALASSTFNFAIYDPLTNEWTDPTSIDSSGGMRFAPRLSSFGGDVQLIWVEDTDANPFTRQDGVIMHAIWSGGVWSQPQMIPSSRGVESNPSLSVIDGGSILTYTRSNENNSEIIIHIWQEDGGWDAGNSISNTNQTLTDSQTVQVNGQGVVYWIENNALNSDGNISDNSRIMIYQSNDSQGIPLVFHDSDSEIYSLGVAPSIHGLYAVVWSEPSANQTLLKARVCNQGTCNLEVINMATENTYISQIEAVVEVREGRLIVAYSVDSDNDSRIVKIATSDLNIIDSELPDLTYPTTTSNLGATYWYSSQTEIHLNASDDRSGINKTEYRINDGEWQDYLHPINVSQDGEYVVDYHSIDNSGNIEPINEIIFGMDATAPEVELDISHGPVSVDENNTREIYIRLEAVDSGSGISSIELLVNGDQKNLSEITTSENIFSDDLFTDHEANAPNHIKVILARGNHTIQLNVYDVAGNIATETLSFEVLIEITESELENPSTDSTNTNVTDKSKSSSTTVAFAAVGSVGVIIVLFGFLGSARRKKKLAEKSSSQPRDAHTGRATGKR